MSLSKKTLAVYYHMPYIIDGSEIYANPTIGTFIESLSPHFKEIVVIGFESRNNSDRISYALSETGNIKFVSLGLEGKFWDHFQKMRRVKKSICNYCSVIDILLLRVPSHLAYAVWKYLNKPKFTVLLFVGNPYFTAASHTTKLHLRFFRKFRSDIHDKRMWKICRKTSALVIANSKELANVWSRILNTSVKLLQTSSLSKHDIVSANSKKSVGTSFKLLFVGRICFDKGIRELLEALRILNIGNNEKFHLDIVGPIDDLGDTDLIQLTDKYGVSSQVSYHGVIAFGAKLYEFYRNADVYVLPSYHEGMPHAIWEAMSQGTPVIASPVGGISDFFVNYEDILFVKVKDSQSIADAVLKLQQNDNLRQKLSTNGIIRVSSVTREVQAENIAELMTKQWKNGEI